MGGSLWNARSRVLFLYSRSVKFFTSNLHKNLCAILLKLVQFDTCIFPARVVYSNQEVRERTKTHHLLCTLKNFIFS
nr:MAG TPA: hypothetical protein [Caudoviricetes sp.]